VLAALAAVDHANVDAWETFFEIGFETARITETWGTSPTALGRGRPDRDDGQGLGMLDPCRGASKRRLDPGQSRRRGAGRRFRIISSRHAGGQRNRRGDRNRYKTGHRTASLMA